MGEAPAGRSGSLKAAWPERGARRPPALRAAERGGSANVLIIILDAARADHFSCYGYGRPTTPRIDVLAETSAVFGDAVSESAYTLASTATILTGLPPDYHGATEAFQSRLGDRTVTLAQLFFGQGLFHRGDLGEPVFRKGLRFRPGIRPIHRLSGDRPPHPAEDFLPPFSGASG
jgi:membrane-anchored protein YejM (alkaline phosphatase superfamily)